MLPPYVLFNSSQDTFRVHEERYDGYASFQQRRTYHSSDIPITIDSDVAPLAISRSNVLNGAYLYVATLMYSTLQELFTSIEFNNGNQYDVPLIKQCTVPFSGNELLEILSVFIDAAETTFEISKLVKVSGNILVDD